MYFKQLQNIILFIKIQGKPSLRLTGIYLSKAVHSFSQIYLLEKISILIESLLQLNSGT